MTTLKLSPDTPNVFIFALQASNVNGAPLTSGQMNAAREAAKSTLELLGCEVYAVSECDAFTGIESGDVLSINSEINK